MPRPWPIALVLLASAAALLACPEPGPAAPVAKPLSAPTTPAPGTPDAMPAAALPAANPAATPGAVPTESASTAGAPTTSAPDAPPNAGGTDDSTATSPAPPQGPPPPEILALASDNTARQWAALDTLRKDPVAARTALLQALQRDPPLPGRWRLILRLEEFGTQDDVPLLLTLRDNAQSPLEKRIAEGAARALYTPVANPVPLEGVVQDFSFIQTHPPAPIADPDRGKWLISTWSVAEYNRDDLPLEIIKAVRPLRGKVFDSQDDLADAIRARLSARQWKAQQAPLMASVVSVPGRVQLDGVVRVRLQDPLQRPLLLSLRLNAWFGRFREPPGATWVYLEGGTTRTVEIPVAPQGLADEPQIRLDLRVKEVDGAFVPVLHKLYLPLHP